jgi:tetratricopeptide (TPR) repeat protein
MKNNLSIILSLVALIGVIVLAVVIACLNISLANVSLDTFIGVMVTMIGILVTFAVGWQIINALEIKSKLAEIEKIKADVNTQQSNINKIAARIAYDAAVNRGYTLQKQGEYHRAFAAIQEAIKNCLFIDEYEDLDMLLKALLSCAANSYNVRRYESDCDYITKLDSEIRETPKFPLIKDRYEEALKEYNRWRHIPIKDKKR